MRILVISDTHDNISAIKHVLGFARTQNMEAIIHCGDWASAQAVLTVLEVGIPLYSVMGNADEARFQEIITVFKTNSSSEIYFAPEVWEGEIDGRRIAMAHKTNQNLSSTSYKTAKLSSTTYNPNQNLSSTSYKPYDLTEQVRSGEFDAIFYGHFHTKAGVKSYGKTLVVNPGALGKTTKPSFAVYDTDTNTAELIKILI